MAPTNFRVVVVGGGPVGLTAAHALEKAGIDFLLIERRPDVVIDAGSNLVLAPIGLRAMAQLGLLAPLNAVSSPLGQIDRMDHKGRDIGDVRWFLEMQRSFGMAPRVISRHDLTRVLHDTLSTESQGKILSGHSLASIEPTEDGVTVTCTNGLSYAASIVIGADGAHSTVRKLMRDLAVDADPTTGVNAEVPFLTTYRCLWVRFPSLGIPAGTTCETHGHNAATQLFAGEETAVLGLYERMEQPTRERVRYTAADQEALVERWGHLPVTPGGKLTLRDIYQSRLEAGMVSLEEGVLEHWSWDGRIALAGDAAHKFTPSTGAGCNNGMIDIVALVNGLRTAVQATSSHPTGTPSRKDIAAVFKLYQQTRLATVTAECAAAGQATGTATWQTGIHKFVDRKIISRHVLQRFLINRGAQSVARTPAFEFVKGGEVPCGRVPWATPLVQAH